MRQKPEEIKWYQRDYITVNGGPISYSVRNLYFLRNGMLCSYKLPVAPRIR